MSPERQPIQSTSEVGIVCRSRGSGPAITDSIKALSATVRVMGPMCSRDSQLETPGYRSSRHPGYSGTRPIDAFMPNNPQWADGIRTDPPPSLPTAMGPIPAATAAPEPALDPPGVIAGFHGLRVVSKTGLCPTPL
jgi:hypothetical protein